VYEASSDDGAIAFMASVMLSKMASLRSSSRSRNAIRSRISDMEFIS
jgi:hypothetical protein